MQLKPRICWKSGVFLLESDIFAIDHLCRLYQTAEILKKVQNFAVRQKKQECNQRRGGKAVFSMFRSI